MWFTFAEPDMPNILSQSWWTETVRGEDGLWQRQYFSLCYLYSSQEHMAGWLSARNQVTHCESIILLKVGVNVKIPNLMCIKIKSRERKVMMPRKTEIQGKILLDSIASIQFSCSAIMLQIIQKCWGYSEVKVFEVVMFCWCVMFLIHMLVEKLNKAHAKARLQPPIKYRRYYIAFYKIIFIVQSYMPNYSTVLWIEYW